MNSVFLSPHFPPNFRNFAIHLKGVGANVLGIADEPYEMLDPVLRQSLTEYYRVSDMHNYDELVRGLGYFTHKYGKLNHLDSHNEYWLETESKLRTDFNIPGIKTDEIDRIKRKSEMKKVFQKAGVKTARGRVCRTPEQLSDFIAEVGYPVVAKPDIGVGAGSTFKLTGDADCERFWQHKPPVDYIAEEFVPGQIVTFDGLVDKRGNVIFSSSCRYSHGVMEVVNADSDMYYYAVTNIEPDLEQAGLATLKAFDVKARFFHFEFFRTTNGEIMSLEVNMRPPGGLTLDMFNFVFDFDCYRTWAEMIVNDVAQSPEARKHSVMFVGRKDHIPYSISHTDILDRFRALLVHHERISPVFAGALGNHGYVLRNRECAPLIEAAETIQKRA